MPQALPVASPAPGPVTAGVGPQAAETAISGQSFSDALSNELDAGDTPPVTAGREAAPAEPATPTTGKATDAATLAAGGNSLPPPLPAEAMLTLAMQVAGATPNPVASDVPTGTPAPETSPRPDAAIAGSSDAAPAIVPAAALAAAAFVLPAAGSADSPAGSGSTATATTAATPTVTAAKPSLPVPHVAAALNSQNLAAAGAASGSASVEVDPSAVATQAVAESTSALADGPKAAATPARAEPVIDMSSLVVPTHGSVESVAALTNAPAPASTGSTVPGATVSVPFGQPAWGQAFGNQVVWAVNQGLPTAALHLSPPELGPVSVHIRLDQDQASIAFSSPHAAVRDAIDAALPRLRDMLGSQGIALVDVNVSQHGSSQAHSQARDYAPGGRRATESQDPPAVPVSPIRQAVLGVLDLYA